MIIVVDNLRNIIKLLAFDLIMYSLYSQLLLADKVIELSNFFDREFPLLLEVEDLFFLTCNNFG
jgi:hypothetical protein